MPAIGGEDRPAVPPVGGRYELATRVEFLRAEDVDGPRGAKEEERRPIGGAHEILPGSLRPGKPPFPAAGEFPEAPGVIHPGAGQVFPSSLPARKRHLLERGHRLSILIPEECRSA